MLKNESQLKNKDLFDRGDVSQRAQYAFPYHYIPSIENGNFRQHLYWSWGLQYLGGLELVFSILDEKAFQSLVDIGCGDGRFLGEVNKRFIGKRLIGIDYSPRAIDLSRIMNPELSFKCIDICADHTFNELFDILTLIEVLEHIPIESTDDFVSAFAGFHKSCGRLILTVPHKNKYLQYKHYQHFDSEMLKKILEPYYEIERFVYFEKISKVANRIIKILLRNRLFILNNRFLLNTIFHVYRRHFQICSESRCGRICIVGRRK